MNSSLTPITAAILRTLQCVLPSVGGLSVVARILARRFGLSFCGEWLGRIVPRPISASLWQLFFHKLIVGAVVSSASSISQ